MGTRHWENMTNEERQWLTDIHRLGCVICLMLGWGETPAEAHHMLSGGRRRGHLWSIPICAVHHRGGVKQIVSRDHNQRRFESKYGTEEDLLAETQRRVREMRAMAVA